VLRAIHQKHPDAIVFENIDVLLGKAISLDPADVDAKLIAAGRGGYCYEQNGLFKRVLTALGFEVTGLMARVLWMAPDRPAAAPALAHGAGRARPATTRSGWPTSASAAAC
jgi:N-hydroxyarylamine O-acetyltransferase